MPLMHLPVSCRLLLSGKSTVATIRRRLGIRKPAGPDLTTISLDTCQLAGRRTERGAEAWRTHGRGFARRGEGRIPHEHGSYGKGTSSRSHTLDDPSRHARSPANRARKFRILMDRG